LFDCVLRFIHSHFHEDKKKMKKMIIFLLIFITAFITPEALAINCVLSLDGDGDYVEMPDAESLDLTANFTFEAWVFPTTTAGVNIIFNKEETYQWAIRDGNLQWALKTGESWVWHDTGISVLVNQWTHLALTYDANNVSAYSNGLLLSTIPDRGNLEVNDSHLWLGGRSKYFGSFFAGLMDKVRIWNIARTQEEIKQTMHTTLSGNEPGLVGYWRFDTGNNAVDSSPSSSDGKLYGDAHFAEAELPKPGEKIIPTMIQGRLLMLDNVTPHVAVPVQAIRDGKVIATTLSDEKGIYQFINPKPGQYQLRCHVLGGYVYYGEEKAIKSEDGTAPDESVGLRVERGKTLRNINFRFAPFKKGTWRTYRVVDGLAHDWIIDIYRDPNGVMWFATDGCGISRYDGNTFTNFTVKDGLASTSVNAIHRAPDGVMWFATEGGVSSYDGKTFTSFTAENGLPSNRVNAIHQDPDDVMWFATEGGVSRYDGETFVNLTARDGLAHNWVNAIHQDPDGVMWFGTYGGVSRYDGETFVNFIARDGLANNWVNAIHRDPDGVIWFGTVGGVSMYDGDRFVNFTTEDGLVHNYVLTIHRDTDGVMWFGTYGGGVSRYDGETFVNFTTGDGLTHNRVHAIHEDPDGVMWFGTKGGGVAGYDGVAWTLLDERDGLQNNALSSIHQDADGFLWFGTHSGVSRYCPSKTSPKVHIVFVTTDKAYSDLSALPSFTTGTRITIQYGALDFKTIPEKQQYRCRIREIDSDWRKPTKATSSDFIFGESGIYTFEVQAIDRDLNYSEPVTLTLQIKRPWWFFALFGTLGIIIPIAVVGFYIGKRLQTQRAIAQQFNPYIAGRVVGEDLFYGRNDLLTDIERTLANNCFLLYGERRIGKTSLQHQLKERLQNANDPTYLFIPAYIDLQGVAEDDFFRTIAAGIVEHAASLFKGGREALALRLDEDRERYSYRDLNRDLRTILDHLKSFGWESRGFPKGKGDKEGETKEIKLVLLMDEIDTLNEYNLRTNLNLRGLFMGQLKQNLVLVMSGLYLKMDWSKEGGGSPPFNFLSREIELQPLNEPDARQLITEPVKGFYSYESEAVDVIISLSELRPFTIQGFCLRAVNRILADGRTKITIADIQAIKESVLAEVKSIRGEHAGTSLPASLNEALVRLADLEAENKRLREEVA